MSNSQANRRIEASFEFFPPNSEKMEAQLWAAVERLAPLGPRFVSVTYGAGGSTRDRTHAIVSRIQKDLGITAMAHQTCVAATRDDVRRSVESLEASGIENILALRGDPPEQDTDFEPTEGGFAHATDLIEYLQEHHDLSIGGAFYPERHPESSSAEDDLHHIPSLYRGARAEWAAAIVTHVGPPARGSSRSYNARDGHREAGHGHRTRERADPVQRRVSRREASGRATALAPRLRPSVGIHGRWRPQPRLAAAGRARNGRRGRHAERGGERPGR